MADTSPHDPFGTMEIERAIQSAVDRNDLSADHMQSVIEQMLLGTVSNESIAQLLLALREKGESVSELVGAARAMRAHMTPVKTSRTNLLDTCGTGGDGAKTFNISTAVAIVAAAAGVPVAKHGNRKITSSTGSADVLESLGIHIEADRDTVAKCIDELGIGFCFAPLLHPAMRHVGQVRRSLGVPTLFNYLGPLCNPAGASFQILGVGRADLQDKLASALAELPIERAMVVRGLDGLDEVTLSAETETILIENKTLVRQRLNPESFGLKTIDPATLFADNPAESAAVIRHVLAGKQGGPRDIVLANVSAALWVARKVSTFPEGVKLAENAIDTGRAAQLLESLGQKSRGS